jgi:hypothetical protein
MDRTGVFNFTRLDPPGYPATGPAQGFKFEWYSPETAALFPGGPYACTLVDKSESVGGTTSIPAVAVPAPKYVLESLDGTIMGADLAKGRGRPLGDKKYWSQNIQRQIGTLTSADMYDVKWYEPIGKVVKFNREQAGEMLDTGYQIVFYFDCPTLSTSVTPMVVGSIPKISVKVYYR